MTMQTASPAMRADYLSRKTDEWATNLEANAADARRSAEKAKAAEDVEAARSFTRTAQVLETRARDYREVRAILNGSQDAYILSLRKQKGAPS